MHVKTPAVIQLGIIIFNAISSLKIIAKSIRFIFIFNYYIAFALFWEAFLS